MTRMETDLEELLSAPTQGDIDALAQLSGDILILGAAGKMGPSLAHRAKRAAGAGKRIIAVARFSDGEVEERLRAWDVETLRCDLLKPGALDQLPDVPNVIYMAARKFGTSGAAHLTWAMNTYLPGLVAERFHKSRIVAFSTGNVYPLVPVTSAGASEDTPTAPVGEYAQSALGRERMFEYASAAHGTRVSLLRLNYAIDLRYGVLNDIARRVYSRTPVDVSMGAVNVIWQGDANSSCLRSLGVCQSPPLVLNIAGPEIFSVRWAAVQFGERFGVEPIFQGHEQSTALLSDGSKARRLLGEPSVSLSQMIEWTADWITQGGISWDKPTHFETRDGQF